MAIRKLTEKRFSDFGVVREPLGLVINDEREWYADHDGNVLGIVVRDKMDNDWGYAVLGRDATDKFRYIDGKVSIQTQDACREQLLDKLTKYEATGRTVFDQENVDWLDE